MLAVFVKMPQSVTAARD